MVLSTFLILSVLFLLSFSLYSASWTIARLNMQRNSLTGSLPSEIGLLTNLEFCAIEVNQMIGTLPDELGQLSTLGKHSKLVCCFHCTKQRRRQTGSELIRNPSLFVFFLCRYFLVLVNFFAGANDFTGVLPTEMCQNASQFEALALDCELVECPCCTLCCNIEPTKCLFPDQPGN